MRILLVNGSPRRAAANSRIVLDALRARLGEGHEYRMVETMTAARAEPEDMEVDFIVLAFPLYIDSLHARLLAWLLSCEAMRRNAAGAAGRRIRMIAVANNGFHEGVQNKTALDIVAHFCARCGIEWRGGVGIGTGEMLQNMKGAADEMPIKRPVSRALDAIAARVVDERLPGANLYVQHAFPWLVYRFMANRGWGRHAHAHCVTWRLMKARPVTLQHAEESAWYHESWPRTGPRRRRLTHDCWRTFHHLFPGRGGRPRVLPGRASLPRG